MSFALGALILVLLLLPGAAILKAYYTSLKEKKSSIHIPFDELLFRGIIFSFVIHCCAVCSIKVFGYYVNFQLLYNIIIGKDINGSNVELHNAFLQFSFYTFILTSMCFCSTKAVKRYIQNKNLDLDWSSLRNTNYWFQVFSARYLESCNVQGEREKADLIFLDMLTEKDIIYSGFLLDFNYSAKKDELENIVLQNTVKRVFRKNHDSNLIKRDPAIIVGDAFVIPIRNIINMNIYYVTIQENNTPLSKVQQN